MKSPFPGMDPFIEGCGLWEDFHGHLVQRISDNLAEVVPDRYLVRTGERSYVVLVESEGKTARPFLPDVSITERRRTTKQSRRGSTALAEPAESIQPVSMRPFIAEEHREMFVEIVASDNHNLVTTIELLSPSNKRPQSPGWELYQRKRQGVLLASVALVEIDLLRDGERMPMLDPWPDSPYALLVARAMTEVSKVWPVSLQQPLPPLPVPLKKPDPDIVLQLQPMIDSIYQRYRYERSIDYARQLRPPLSSGDRAWLKQQLQKAARRKG